MFHEVAPGAHYSPAELSLAPPEQMLGARRDRHAEHELELEAVPGPDPRRPAVARASPRLTAGRVLEPVEEERRLRVRSGLCPGPPLLVHVYGCSREYG